MAGPSNPEQITPQERQFQQHQRTLERIVHPDYILENNTIYKQLEAKEITSAEARLRHEILLIKVASQDYMTRLDNARAADIKLADLMVYCQQNDLPLLGMHFDGDNFRLINSKLGHDVGDKVIEALGQALEQTTRSNTDLQARLESVSNQPNTAKDPKTQARLGGDEFFIALPGATLQDALEVFSRVSANFAAIMDNEIPEYKQTFGKSMTVTGGAAQYTPSLDLKPQGFIKRCERATQWGKETHPSQLTISTGDSMLKADTTSVS